MNTIWLVSEHFDSIQRYIRIFSFGFSMIFLKSSSELINNRVCVEIAGSIGSCIRFFFKSDILSDWTRVNSSNYFVWIQSMVRILARTFFEIQMLININGRVHYARCLKTRIGYLKYSDRYSSRNSENGEIPFAMILEHIL